jgi:hypothetical protein
MARRTEPDHASLIHAHVVLNVKVPLEEALADKSMAILLRRVARNYRRRANRVDFQRLAANDHD